MHLITREYGNHKNEVHYRKLLSNNCTLWELHSIIYSEKFGYFPVTPLSHFHSTQSSLAEHTGIDLLLKIAVLNGVKPSITNESCT